MRAVGPWRRVNAAVSPGPLSGSHLPSRRRLRAAPAASARDAPLGWRRPRNEPPSASGRNEKPGEVAGGGGGRRRREAAAGGKERAGWRGAEAARHG